MHMQLCSFVDTVTIHSCPMVPNPASKPVRTHRTLFGMPQRSSWWLRPMSWSSKSVTTMKLGTLADADLGSRGDWRWHDGKTRIALQQARLHVLEATMKCNRVSLRAIALWMALKDASTWFATFTFESVRKLSLQFPFWWKDTASWPTQHWGKLTCWAVFPSHQPVSWRALMKRLSWKRWQMGRVWELCIPGYLHMGRVILVHCTYYVQK